MDLKYNLNLYISKIERSISIKQITEMLSEEYGISKSTFFKDRSIKQKSKESIPTDRLDIYARFFDVNPEQLKNYQIKGRTLKEIQLTKKYK